MASDKKIVLITGGNTGIGFEAAKALYKSPTAYDIIIGTRTIPKGEAAIALLEKEIPDSPSTLSVLQVDLVSDTSLEQAIATLKTNHHNRLDVLVNNAGANLDGEIEAGRMTLRECWNATWDVNVAGTQVLTTLAVPLLLRSADPRIAFLTSGTASLAETLDPESRLNVSPAAGWPKEKGWLPMAAYRSAKTGLNMMMREWHRVLREDGVRVWGVSPGFLATNLTGAGAEVLSKMGAGKPSEGGEFIREVIEGKRDEDVGKLIRRTSVQPW